MPGELTRDEPLIPQLDMKRKLFVAVDRLVEEVQLRSARLQEIDGRFLSSPVPLKLFCKNEQEIEAVWKDMAQKYEDDISPLELCQVVQYLKFLVKKTIPETAQTPCFH